MITPKIGPKNAAKLSINFIISIWLSIDGHKLPVINPNIKIFQAIFLNSLNSKRIPKKAVKNPGIIKRIPAIFL